MPDRETIMIEKGGDRPWRSHAQALPQKPERL
jgi:hypothetical protein